jgi:hypothetical protein
MDLKNEDVALGAGREKLAAAAQKKAAPKAKKP